MFMICSMVFLLKFLLFLLLGTCLCALSLAETCCLTVNEERFGNCPNHQDLRQPPGRPKRNSSEQRFSQCASMSLYISYIHMLYRIYIPIYNLYKIYSFYIIYMIHMKKRVSIERKALSLRLRICFQGEEDSVRRENLSRTRQAALA